MGRISGNGDDKKLDVKIEGAEPVMAALPYMGVSAALLTGTFLLPKEEQWAKVTRLVLAAGGAGAAIVGVVSALRTKKALQPVGPISAAVPPKDQEVPKVGAGRLEEMLKIEFDKLQPTTGSTTRSYFKNQYFEAKVTNDSGRTLTFYPGVAIYSGDGKLYYQTPPLQRKAVTLVPGTSKAMGTPELAQVAKKPDVEPLFMIPSAMIDYDPHTYAVEIHLFRNRDDGEYFMKSESIPIKYSWIG